MRHRGRRGSRATWRYEVRGIEREMRSQCYRRVRWQMERIAWMKIWHAQICRCDCWGVRGGDRRRSMVLVLLAEGRWLAHGLVSVVEFQRQRLANRHTLWAACHVLAITELGNRVPTSLLICIALLAQHLLEYGDFILDYYILSLFGSTRRAHRIARQHLAIHGFHHIFFEFRWNRSLHKIILPESEVLIFDYWE